LNTNKPLLDWPRRKIGGGGGEERGEERREGLGEWTERKRGEGGKGRAKGRRRRGMGGGDKMSEGEERGKRRETEEGERKSRGRREKRERDGERARDTESPRTEQEGTGRGGGGKGEETVEKREEGRASGTRRRGKHPDKNTQDKTQRMRPSLHSWKITRGVVKWRQTRIRAEEVAQIRPSIHNLLGTPTKKCYTYNTQRLPPNPHSQHPSRQHTLPPPTRADQPYLREHQLDTLLH